MINKIAYSIIGLALFLSACKKKEQEVITEETATYTVTFKGKWTSVTHPNSYPTNDHFSTLIGLTHASNVSIAKEGTKATPGIKSLAETGSTSPLTTELNAITSNNEGKIIMANGGVTTGSSSVSVDFTIHKNTPHVSLVTMLAPSPDWYVGALNVNLYNGETFNSSITVDAVLYDAGTDDGISYTSANSPTNPQDNITKLVSAPIGNGSSVATVGTFTFVKK